MRAVYLKLLFATLCLCGACWRSYQIGEAGMGGGEAQQPSGAGTGGGAIPIATDAEGGDRQPVGGSTGGTYPATAGSVGSWCGDGIVSGPEHCDGDDLNGASCATLGMGEGMLSCYRDNCTYDATMCAVGPAYPTEPASGFPDGRYYDVPVTPEGCINLSDHLVRTYTPYTVMTQPRSCLCGNCLDVYGLCIVDYDCLSILTCCADTGVYTLDCQSVPPCSEIISRVMTGGDMSSAIKAVEVGNCLEAACLDAVPSR